MARGVRYSKRQIFTLCSVGIGGGVFYSQLVFGAARENVTVLAAVLTVVIAVTSVCFGAARAVEGDAVHSYRCAGRTMFQAGLIILAALMFQFVSVNSGWQIETDYGVFAKMSSLILLTGMIYAMFGLSYLCDALDF